MKKPTKDPAAEPTKEASSTMAVQDKVLAVLDTFSIERPSMSRSDLARATGLPMSTVHRIVARRSFSCVTG
ncbi:helix-turn-helix domain-containing protein [Agromyces bauzanensis]